MGKQRAHTRRQASLAGGVLVLLPAALFSKLIGLFYKIPLLFVVGVEGMAYFLAAYHIYSLLFVISSTGLPSALSISVSGYLAQKGGQGAARRAFFVALVLFLSIGLCGTLFLCLFADTIASLLAMPQAAKGIVAIAPALFLATFCGAVRGFFQGHRYMASTAVSEVIESCGKLCFGVAFAWRAAQKGLAVEEVAAYAIFGITAGMAFSALYLLFLLLRFFAEEKICKTHTVSLPKRRTVLSKLCRVALPITLSASVLSLVSLIDTALISNLLQRSGFAAPLAHAMYSSYGNLAVPLYNLVPSLLSPITLALMPMLGAACARGDLPKSGEALRSALRVIFLVAIPASLGLAAFSEPILRLIYAGRSDAVAMAAPLLSFLCLSILPTALVTLMGAALQASGHTATPVLAMGVGAAVKLFCEAILLQIPSVNIYAAPISTLFCQLTVLSVEAVALSRALPLRLHLGKDLFCPLFCALFSVGLGIGAYAAGLYLAVPFLLLLPCVLLLTVLCYGVLSLKRGAVGREDLAHLPFGERLCALLEKMRLFKGEGKTSLPCCHIKEKKKTNDDRGRKKENDFGKEGIYCR